MRIHSTWIRNDLNGYLENNRRRNVDFRICIEHHGHNLYKLRTIIEAILFRQNICSGNKILSCSDQKLSISWSDEIIFHLQSKQQCISISLCISQLSTN